MMSSNGKSRSMFRKPKRKIIQKTRKRDDDECEEISFNQNSLPNESVESTLHVIQRVKKTRKIKSKYRSQVQLSSKEKSNVVVPADKLQIEKEQQAITEANQDLKRRLEGNFSINEGSKNDEDGNIMTKKHKIAMQQYIDSQMIEKGACTGGTVASDQIETNAPPIDVKNTNDLYAQILHQSNELLHRESAPSNSEEGDTGAGGSMLGGTGIAEIVLPVEDRIKTAKETELAASRSKQFRSARNKPSNAKLVDEYSQDEMPVNFGLGPGKSSKNVTLKKSFLLHPTSTETKISPLKRGGRVLNKDALPEMASSYTHNFRLHNEEWISKKKRIEQESKTNIPDTEIDDTRIGFEVSRGLKSDRGNDPSTNRGSVKRANDDRTYKKFLKREFNNKRR